MKKMNTVKEITEEFNANGWNDVTFTEVTKAMTEESGHLFMAKKMETGQKFFKMNETGNIFNEYGNVEIYNARLQ